MAVNERCPIAPATWGLGQEDRSSLGLKGQSEFQEDFSSSWQGAHGVALLPVLMLEHEAGLVFIVADQ